MFHFLLTATPNGGRGSAWQQFFETKARRLPNGCSRSSGCISDCAAISFFAPRGRPRVRVLHPGFWNHEAGPDFRGVALQFEGEEPSSGDIEVDCIAAAAGARTDTTLIPTSRRLFCTSFGKPIVL